MDMKSILLFKIPIFNLSHLLCNAVILIKAANKFSMSFNSQHPQYIMLGATLICFEDFK